MGDNTEERTDILIDRYQMGDLDDANIGELIDGLLARLEWAMPKAHAYDSELRNHKRNELRDNFAAKALPAIISAEGINQHASSDLVDAKIAYRYADAMLKAREQQP